MHPLNFLDVNCGIGTRRNVAPDEDVSAAALLRAMDEQGIAEACPFHAIARDHCLAEGNAALIDDTRGHERLRPVWIVSPHHTGECLRPDELLAAMKTDGVRLARICFGPEQYVPRLDLFVFEGLFDALAGAAVPLIVTYQDAAAVAWAEIADALARWPGLRIILGTPKVTFHDRCYYALWERFDSFFVELSGYQVMDGIENVTRQFGPDRLVFGTRYPHFGALQTMLHVIYAEVDDEVKRGIAGDTVRRLMEEVAL